MPVLLRFLAVLGLAFWLGGVAFYGAVVIPEAHDTLESHREIGFVTRAVTGTANTIGFAVLGLLLANAVVAYPRSSKSTRIMLVGGLVAMVLAQVGLFVLRRTLNGMLDPSSLSITDRGRFMPLHERYLNVTSVLCMAGLVYLWALLLPPKQESVPPPTR